MSDDDLHKAELVDNIDYDNGWEAYHNGLELTHNPHVYNTIPYKNWEDGWLDAEGNDIDEIDELIWDNWLDREI